MPAEGKCLRKATPAWRCNVVATYSWMYEFVNTCCNVVATYSWMYEHIYNYII